MMLFPLFYFKKELRITLLPFIPLVSCSCQQLSVLMFTHFLFSFLDYTSQKITSKHEIN